MGSLLVPSKHGERVTNCISDICKSKKRVSWHLMLQMSQKTCRNSEKSREMESWKREKPLSDQNNDSIIFRCVQGQEKHAK